VAIGTLQLGTLQPGESREVRDEEMRALREMLGRRGRKKGEALTNRRKQSTLYKPCQKKRRD
jgi:hypothetical protein